MFFGFREFFRRLSKGALKHHGHKNTSIKIIVFSVLLVIIIPLVLVIIFAMEKPGVEKRAYASLDSISRLKASQVENWLNERKSDGHLFISDIRFFQFVERLKGNDQIAQRYLNDQLNHLRMTFHYDAVLLLDTSGRRLLSIGEHQKVYPETLDKLPAAALKKDVIINNINLEGDTGEPYMDFIIPLSNPDINSGSLAGFVIFHINPKKFLFPFIQEWPGGSRTGETLLVRKSNDTILFLNELKFRKNLPLKFKMPLTEQNLVAAIALRSSVPGYTRGVDYRGENVLAAFRPVEGTDWIVVSKMDRREVFSDLYNLIWWIGLIATISMAGIIFMVVQLLWQQEKAYQLEIQTQSMNIKKIAGHQSFALSQSAHDALVTINDKGIVADWNPGAENIFQYGREEIIGEDISRIIPPRTREDQNVQTPAFKKQETNWINEELLEFIAVRKSGEEFPIEFSIAKWEYQDSIFYSVIIRDISKKKEYERKIHRLTQLYSALSQCNEAIVRSTTKEELFPLICQYAVLIGGMRMAWIGQINAEKGEISVFASYGDTTGYLNSEKFNYMCREFMNIYSKSLNLNEPFWFQDYQNEGNKIHQEMVLHAGLRSSGSLPLRQNGHTRWILNIYSELPGAFDIEVKKLLLEMQSDINFALENFAREEERKKSAVAIRESEQKFRNMIEQPLVGVSIIQNGRFVYANPRCAEIFGFADSQEINGKALLNLVVEGDRDKVNDKINNWKQNDDQGTSYEFGIKKKNGEIIYAGVHATHTDHNGRPAIFNLLQDITEKKQAEEKIQNYITQLQNAFVHTVEVVNTMSEMRDPYTAGHERRVADLAVAIGREMGFNERELEGLKISGWLHDLGKITIPAEMLAKPRKLTEAEYNLIKQHPQTGFDIIKQVEFPWPGASVVLQHHERIDGSGYPFGLKGSEILVEAKIMAIADVVEAMASHRPYRPGLGLDRALKEIEDGKGTIYDAQIAEVCLYIFKNKIFTLAEI